MYGGVELYFLAFLVALLEKYFECIQRPTRCTFFMCVYTKIILYMFRTDTPFIVRSLRIAVYVAVCTYTAIRKLLTMNGVSVRNM